MQYFSLLYFYLLHLTILPQGNFRNLIEMFRWLTVVCLRVTSPECICLRNSGKVLKPPSPKLPILGFLCHQLSLEVYS